MVKKEYFNCVIDFFLNYQILFLHGSLTVSEHDDFRYFPLCGPLGKKPSENQTKQIPKKGKIVNTFGRSPNGIFEYSQENKIFTNHYMIF